MNIRQAKEEIKHTVQAYLKKDESGAYHPAEAGAAYRSPWSGKDPDNGADIQGMQGRADILYHHPSHQTERGRPSVYP